MRNCMVLLLTILSAVHSIKEMPRLRKRGTWPCLQRKFNLMELDN